MSLSSARIPNGFGEEPRKALVVWAAAAPTGSTSGCGGGGAPSWGIFSWSRITCGCSGVYGGGGEAKGELIAIAVLKLVGENFLPP